MKKLSCIVFLLFASLLFTNCSKNNDMDDPGNKDPDKPKIRDCEKETYGFIEFENRTDYTLAFYKTTNTNNPIVTVPPTSVTTIRHDTISKFYYKIKFLDCTIQDNYGMFHVKICDTTYFLALVDGRVGIRYVK